MKLLQVPAKYILLVAFILKAFYLFFFVDHIRQWEDHDIAVNLVKTGSFFINMDGINSHSFQFPIYPFLVSLLYRLCGVQPIVACFFNLFINTACGFLFVRLVKEILAFLNIPHLSNAQTHIVVTISLLCYLIHPAINFYTLYNVHPFIENMFFLFLILYLSFRCAWELSFKNTLLLGLALGVAMLDRGTALTGIIPFFIIAYKQDGLRKAVVHSVVICLTGLLICLSWIIHNYVKDDFIGLISSGGKDMYKGVLPNSDGSNYLNNGNNYYEAFSRHETDSVARISAGAQNHYYMSKIYTQAKNNPGFVVKMFFLKLKNFWWFRSGVGNEQSGRINRFVPAYKITYGIILLLQVASLLIIGKRMWVVLATPVALSVLQAAFYVETRHRIIIEPLLIFIAVTVVIALINSRTTSKVKTE